MRLALSWQIPLLLAGCSQSADVLGGHREPAPPPPPEDTGWETDFPACATQVVEAVPIDTNLLLAVDSSCSMADPADGRTTGTTTGTLSKWDAATSAFTAFFTDPSSTGLDVGLRLWPTASDGCDDVACDPVACSQPQVPLDSLGDAVHRQALVDALANTVPEGGTPMHAALDGALRWAAAEAIAAPDAQIAVVLVTDGEPNGCDEDITHIADLATAAAATGIPVYAVGIEGSNVAQIDQIAAAGGTNVGYFVGSANSEADLVAALKDIQAQQVSCAFTFPTESTGEDPLSPDLVRVEYTIDGDLVLAQRLADASLCGPDGGWYLDDPADPSTITLCPTTCAALQGITVEIEIAVGCECLTDADCPDGDVCASDGCVPPCEGADCPAEPTPEGPEILGNLAVQGGAWRCDGAGVGPVAWAVLAALALARRRAS
jgi:hypothetical protein